MAARTPAAGFLVLVCACVAEERNAGFQFHYAHHGEDWPWGQCQSRERQSPIDFDGHAPWQCQMTPQQTYPCDKGSFHYKYEEIDADIPVQNTGHSISWDFIAKGYGGIMYDNGWFNLLNINIHAESEHKLKGRRLPLELHFVHKSYDSNHIIVIAVPFETPSSINAAAAAAADLAGKKKAQEEAGLGGGDDPALLQLGSNASATKRARRAGLRGQHSHPLQPDLGGEGFNKALQRLLTWPLPGPDAKAFVQLEAPTDMISDFFKDGTFFDYHGSFTAPPCYEQITWLVRRDPLVASDAQALYLTRAVMETNSGYGNWRQIMPTMGRPIFVRKAINGEPPAQSDIPTIEPGVTFAPQWDPNTVRASDFRAVAEGENAYGEAQNAVHMSRDVGAHASQSGAAMDTIYGALPSQVLNGPTGPPQPAAPAPPGMVMAPPPTSSPGQGTLDVLSKIAGAVTANMVASLKNAAVAAASAGVTLPPGSGQPLNMGESKSEFN